MSALEFLGMESRETYFVLFSLLDLRGGSAVFHGRLIAPRVCYHQMQSRLQLEGTLRALENWSVESCTDREREREREKTARAHVKRFSSEILLLGVVFFWFPFLLRGKEVHLVDSWRRSGKRFDLHGGAYRSGEGFQRVRLESEETHLVHAKTPTTILVHVVSPTGEQYQRYREGKRKERDRGNSRTSSMGAYRDTNKNTRSRGERERELNVDKKGSPTVTTGGASKEMTGGGSEEGEADETRQEGKRDIPHCKWISTRSPSQQRSPFDPSVDRRMMRPNHRRVELFR